MRLGRQVVLRHPGRYIGDDLGCERLVCRRALERQHAHRKDDEHGGDQGDRAGTEPACAAAVEERQQQEEDEADRRHPDRAEEDRLRPLEDPEQIEEEVEVPVRPRHEARGARIGRRVVLRPEETRVQPVVMRAVRRPLPDRRERDDHGHDDEAHDRVVEHRVRVEGLPPLLDVGLVLRELRALLLDGGRLLLADGGHYSDPPGSPCGEIPRGTGCVSPGRSGACPSSDGSIPAASFDHGGDVTPSRITR